jgi:hypothetical protein
MGKAVGYSCRTTVSESGCQKHGPRMVFEGDLIADLVIGPHSHKGIVTRISNKADHFSFF